MDEYISRKDAIKELHEVYEYEYPTASGDFDEYASHYVPNILKNIPAADVQPVIHAYWIELPKALNPNENPCKCSNCGHILSFMNGYPKSKYCDECGAKMDIIYEDDKIRAIKVTGWNNDTRNLTDKETEAETIDEISLL
jgi:hypothetical protein